MAVPVQLLQLPVKLSAKMAHQQLLLLLLQFTAACTPAGTVLSAAAAAALLGRWRCCCHCSPIADAHVAVSICACCVQDDCQQRHDGFQQHKLQRALLATPQEEPIHLHSGQAASHVRP
jgi:hypothetical protein